MESRCSQTFTEVLHSLIVNYPELAACESDVQSAAELMLSAFSSGYKLLVCGNGGSAADSEHVVGELMKSFRFKRPASKRFLAAYREKNGEDAPTWLEGALPAISLVSQTALFTAFGNDSVSTGVFAQQVYGYGREGDVLLAISTSGNSKNVVEAAKVARAIGVHVVSLTGEEESLLMRFSDVCIRVPRREVFRIQELHLPVYHALCAAVESALFGGCQ